MAIDTNNGRITACKINNDYYGRHTINTVPETKQYYLDLREAIIYELRTYGFCDLLDQYLEEERSIQCIDLAVFLDIDHGYKKNNLADISNKEYSTYVPYVKYTDFFQTRLKKVRWVDVIKSGLPYQFTEEVRMRLNHVRTIVRDEHVLFVDNNINEMNAHAYNEKEIADRITQAENQASEILEKARNEAKEITDKAQDDAREVIIQANVQAQEDAEKRATELIARYVEKQQKQYRKEIDIEMEKITLQYIENTLLAETKHKEMCDTTIQFQGQLVSTINSTIDSLNSVKTEFYNHLRNWQTSLILNEFKPLAACYIQWYQLINVDKIISQEVVFRKNAERSLVENFDNENNEKTILSEEASIEGSVSCSEVSRPMDTTIQGLQNLNKNLTILLKNYEKALNGIDLYVYYPKTGEKFDFVKHTLEDDNNDGDCSDRFIIDYILPGIAKKMDDNDEDEIVLKALVRVTTEN